MAAPVLPPVQCMAAVLMSGGNELSLLKLGRNTITASLDPECGRFKRGKSYRVWFEEVDPDDPPSSFPPHTTET